jgi:hypothetical protein
VATPERVTPGLIFPASGAFPDAATGAAVDVGGAAPADAEVVVVVGVGELDGVLTGGVVTEVPIARPRVAAFAASAVSVPFARVATKVTTTAAVTTDNATTDTITRRLGTAPPEPRTGLTVHSRQRRKTRQRLLCER